MLESVCEGEKFVILVKFEPPVRTLYDKLMRERLAYYYSVYTVFNGIFNPPEKFSTPTIAERKNSCPYMWNNNLTLFFCLCLLFVSLLALKDWNNKWHSYINGSLFLPIIVVPLSGFFFFWKIAEICRKYATEELFHSDELRKLCDIVLGSKALLFEFLKFLKYWITRRSKRLKVVSKKYFDEISHFFRTNLSKKDTNFWTKKNINFNNSSRYFDSYNFNRLQQLQTSKNLMIKMIYFDVTLYFRIECNSKLWAQTNRTLRIFIKLINGFDFFKSKFE